MGFFFKIAVLSLIWAFSETCRHFQQPGHRSTAQRGRSWEAQSHPRGDLWWAFIVIFAKKKQRLIFRWPVRQRWTVIVESVWNVDQLCHFCSERGSREEETGRPFHGALNEKDGDARFSDYRSEKCNHNLLTTHFLRNQSIEFLSIKPKSRNTNDFLY